ncbi:MAG TPA: carboxymuconolactone decarboxylase family protein [bacterium]|nr:carboxymuconolactone decarboxylase family protein [bacterium]
MKIENMKRFYKFSDFVKDLGKNALNLPVMAKSMLSGSGIDPKFREKIMLSISNMNQCRHCIAVHGTFADLAGLSEEEKSALQNLSPEFFDHKEWIAIEYARRLVADECDGPDGFLLNELGKHYSDEEIRSIEAIAYSINLANRCGNTWDAFTDRLRGKPAGESALVDELLILATIAPAGPALLLLMLIVKARKKKSEQVLGDTL